MKERAIFVYRNNPQEIDMPGFKLGSVVAPVVVSLALAACGATGPDASQVWGSDQAGLRVSDTGATIQILASGGCYGSYGEINQPIPSGNFSLSGTYTQLTGAAPGSVQYPAQYNGSISGAQMTITITIAAPPLVVGPFHLAQGVSRVWPACMFP